MSDPTHDPLFDSAWLKWGRAVTHADTLDADIKRMGVDSNREPFGTLATKYNPKRHGFALTVESTTPLPPRWNLLLGDVVHNFHCALDHVAWAVVQRGRTPNLTVAQAKRVYFPIATSRADFTRQIKRKLPGVRHADLAIIRRCQPYLQGKTRVPWHCLSILSDMSNSDKHREIQEVLMVPDRAECEVVSEHDCAVTRLSSKGGRVPMNVGAEIAFIYARKTGPEPHLQVKYELFSYPAINKQLWLQHWMDITQVTIWLMLGDFADAPESLTDLRISKERFDAAIQTWSDMAQVWATASGTRATPRARTFGTAGQLGGRIFPAW